MVSSGWTGTSHVERHLFFFLIRGRGRQQAGSGKHQDHIRGSARLLQPAARPVLEALGDTSQRGSLGATAGRQDRRTTCVDAHS
ncbi:hypothetical protein LY76DRAFT_184960 [Colletotrichum caudatum]|nr:hypothetical protein LY76DRAFT_184960 [Colletotrichum caudatum]